MKFPYLLLCAAGMPLLAAAQAESAAPAAANPNAPSAPLQYHSVFADEVVATAPAQSPDKGWIAANRAVTDEQAQPPAPAVPAAAQPAHAMHDHKEAHQ